MMGMDRVFYGCDGRSVDHLLGGGYVDHILISAIMLWRQGNFSAPLRLPDHDTLFLDSGGFTFTSRRGSYPFTPQQYSEIAQKIRADHVSVMDYPCPLGDQGNIERINKTIENSTACQTIEGIPWVQVVQGGNLTEYQYCCDKIRSEGLETSVLAIGSLKCRTTTAEVLGILRLVARNFPQARLHAFGANLQSIRNRATRNLLWSSDTTAWRFNQETGHRFPTSQDEKLMNYTRYRSEVDRILELDSQQVSLKFLRFTRKPEEKNADSDGVSNS